MKLPGFKGGSGALKGALKALSPKMAEALDTEVEGTVKATMAVRLGLPEDAGEDRIVARLQESPEAPAVIRDSEQQLKSVLSENDIKMADLLLQDREAARERFGSDPFVRAFACAIALIAFAFVFWILYAEVHHSAALDDSMLAGNAMTLLTTTIGVITGYYWGQNANGGR